MAQPSQWILNSTIGKIKVIYYPYTMPDIKNPETSAPSVIITQYWEIGETKECSMCACPAVSTPQVSLNAGICNPFSLIGKSGQQYSVVKTGAAGYEQLYLQVPGSSDNILLWRRYPDGRITIPEFYYDGQRVGYRTSDINLRNNDSYFLAASQVTESSPGYVVATAKSRLGGAFPITTADIRIVRPISFAALVDIFVGGKPPATDPYDEIPESGPSTPSGTYDFTTSDAISFPTLPQLSAVSTGFISLWSPSEEQMLKLSSFMWNADPLTIDFWKKIVADPMKLIYGLNIIPLDLEEMGLVDGEGTVVVGLIDTGVLMNHLSTQWIELDCGSITLDETWSAYLDYDPYTKLEIYLPYCGTHPLKVDDFMPGTISLKYHIDLLSGACVAILVSTKSDKHGDTLNSVVYQFMGNCASQLPVTSEQYADAVRSVIQLAASIGTMVALGAGGAGAGAAVASTALPTAWGHFDSPLHTTSALSTQVAGLVPAEDMGPIDWRGYMPSAGTPSVAETASKAGGTLKKIGGIHAASAAVENVMGIKPNIERSGAIGSTGGLLSVQTPYLILTRPRQARPEDQNKYTGYPSFITETLGDLEGWTIVQAIHLENIACTAEELAEIDELLKSGVIF